MPNLDNRFDGAFADILDGGQAEPDRMVHHGKILLAFVHVRRQDFDIEIPAFRKIADDLIGVAHVGRHQGGHEFGRIVGFKYPVW